ncbi:hypothetical protein N8500_04050 [Candidatus Puniceispirillum sp.]|nr:hypothetical protein [Candidatus Puniceispirillum sp.]
MIKTDKITGKKIVAIDGLKFIMGDSIPFTGTVVNHYDDGVLNGFVNFKNGLQHGKSLNYDKDGRIKHESEWFNGKIHGTSKMFQTGFLRMETKSRNGQRQVVKKYENLDGKVTEVLYFQNGKYARSTVPS